MTRKTRNSTKMIQNKRRRKLKKILISLQIQLIMQQRKVGMQLKASNLIVQEEIQKVELDNQQVEMIRSQQMSTLM